MKFETYPLYELCSIITDGSHSSPKSVAKGYYMASVKDMTDFGFDLSECRQIGKEDYEILVRNGCQPKSGDVLIAKDGNSYMEHYFCYKGGESLVILSSIAIIRPDTTKLDSRYLLYYIQEPSVKADIKTNYVSGSAIPRIVLRSFKSIPIKIPSLPEQRAIARILSSLDDKIELNNRMNKTLEEIAQAIFTRWFVDFEFPDENGNPYKSSGGLMIDSELGRIPVGWTVENLPDIFEFQEGPGIRNWQYVNENGVKFINIRCIQNNDLRLDTANMISEEEAYGKYAHFLLKEWDIVMSTSGTLGRYAIVRQEHLPLCLNTSVIRFSPLINRQHYSFLYGYLISKEFYEHLITKATGSVQANFGPVHLKQINLVKPEDSVLNHYHSIVFPMIKSFVQIRAEVTSLTQLRDTLLPKLMSGEIRVPITED